MTTQAEALAALDASPAHDATLPFLRAWAESGDPGKARHVLVRLQLPVHPEPVPGPAKPPGLLAQAVAFASAVVTHVAAGMPEVDEAEHQRRLGICQACPEFDAGSVACRICGCNMAIKARWAEQACPIGKW